jgi:hypothetical protein
MGRKTGQEAYCSNLSSSVGDHALAKTPGAFAGSSIPRAGQCDPRRVAAGRRPAARATSLKRSAHTNTGPRS